MESEITKAGAITLVARIAPDAVIRQQVTGSDDLSSCGEPDVVDTQGHSPEEASGSS